MSGSDESPSYKIKRDLGALKTDLTGAEATVNTIAGTISHLATQAHPSFSKSLEDISIKWAAHKQDLTNPTGGLKWKITTVAGKTEWALNDSVTTYLKFIDQLTKDYYEGDAAHFKFTANSDDIVKDSGEMAKNAAEIGQFVHDSITKTKLELKTKTKDLTNQLQEISDQLSVLADSETPDPAKLKALSDKLKEVIAEKAQTEADLDAIMPTIASLHALVQAILEYKDTYHSLTALLPITTAGQDIAVEGLNSLVPIFDDPTARAARVEELKKTFESISPLYASFQT